MILADTSVWVHHFRFESPRFAAALTQGSICVHPVVLGELASGNLPTRQKTLSALRSLPCTKIGSWTECLDFIEIHALHGRGIGWNDIQLLVAARISGNPLWTLDRRLAAAAGEQGVAYQEK